MQNNIVPYAGWKNNARLANAHLEAIITLDVGPRIISLKAPDGKNVFKNYDDQLGREGEPEWQIRGGHRLWVAPEDEKLSYLPDNSPVPHEWIGDNAIRLRNLPVPPWNVRKNLTVTLPADSPEIVVHHSVVNNGTHPIGVTTWGLTVMAPGGLEIIPLPPLGEHPRDLLPNRLIVPWPYFDMTDPRFRFGRRFITLKQDPTGKPAKLGLLHSGGWVAYAVNDALFVKSFVPVPEAAYPDFGCNFETFTNEEMLEVETLGPLRTLAPGESVEHEERWNLLGNTGAPPENDETALADWLAPKLAKIGIR